LRRTTIDGRRADVELCLIAIVIANLPASRVFRISNTVVTASALLVLSFAGRLAVGALPVGSGFESADDGAIFANSAGGPR